MDPGEMCPRPLDKRDASALIGITSILEAELRVGQLDESLLRQVSRRLARAGLLGPDSDVDTGTALAELTQRLHYAWGAYDEPPPSTGITG